MIVAMKLFFTIALLACFWAAFQEDPLIGSQSGAVGLSAALTSGVAAFFAVRFENTDA